MKYVALLSGGKDSCFNLVHCRQNGHELVAAASLGPGEGKEEIDSYLYQTVGQDAIEFVAKALDVPLYRRTISGVAIQQGSEYGSREASAQSAIVGDETEDLFELLSEVKKQHPEISGVSVGAILSNYQRVRVEHVCRRLGLTALCYLWQRDQDQLLEEMINNGMEAILIKVAGIGLKPVHLGKSLSEMQMKLRELNRLYGAHICGEGGEYETLTLDCPLFKRRLHIEEAETIIHSDNDFATVAYLRMKSVSLQDKPAHEEVQPQVLELLDEDHLSFYKDLNERSQMDGSSLDVCSSFDTGRSLEVDLGCKIEKSWIYVTNVQMKPPVPQVPIQEEVKHCFNAVKDCLHRNSASLTDLTYVNLLLSDMSFFAEVNDTYKDFFGTSPPARACIATRLPNGARLRLDCLAYRTENASERQALHVQSLSYWAPANIGPYSQAISVGDRVLISGQIGMKPSDLSLPVPSNFPSEIALSLQHADRILCAMRDTHGSTWAPVMQSLTLWVTDPQNVSRLLGFKHYPSHCHRATILFVGPTMLPKWALVENQVVVHTGRYTVMDDGEVEYRTSNSSSLESGTVKVNESVANWEVSSFSDMSSFSAVVAVKGEVLDVQEQIRCQMQKHFPLPRTFCVRLFHRRSLQANDLQFAQSLPWTDEKSAISTVPVQFLATRDASDWDFALSVLGE